MVDKRFIVAAAWGIFAILLIGAIVNAHRGLYPAMWSHVIAIVLLPHVASCHTKLLRLYLGIFIAIVVLAIAANRVDEWYRLLVPFTILIGNLSWVRLCWRGPRAEQPLEEPT